MKVKRVYETPETDDGVRILIDRLWPRGVKKDIVDIWMKDIAPSDELRKWFNHEPEKWEEFKHKYMVELKSNPKVKVLVEVIRRSENVTFLYATKSPYNSAVVLKEYIESLLTK
ncbi:uroporphyrin-III C-methyltransferase [Sulfolobus acidocaldarius SUSAZ]|nr:uroporphyrin-III C-methyltransferase [Sulfolobus acidocaldarius SUSAZ]